MRRLYTLIFIILISQLILVNGTNVYASTNLKYSSVRLEANSTLFLHQWVWNFTASGQRIEVTNFPDPAQNKITIEVFWKPREYKWHRLVGVWFESPYQFLLYPAPGGAYYFYVYNTSYYVVSSSRYVVGEWQHVVAIFDNGNVSIYINGELDVSTTLGITTIPASTVPLRVGDMPISSNYFVNGTIALVRIYEDRILNTSEVKQNYYSVLYHNTTFIYDGLVLYLDASAYDNGVFVDLSGNGNDGISYNVERIASADAGLAPWIEFDQGFYRVDGLKHLLFFPINTTVRILDYSRGILYSYVNSTDHILDLRDGLYNVEYNVTGKILNIYPAATPEITEIIDVNSLPSLTGMIDFYQNWWGLAFWAVPLMVPATIYLKTKHPGLVAGSIILITAITVVAAPDPVKTLYVIASVAATTLMLYRVFYKKEGY